MSIDQETIIKNTKKYFESLEKIGINSEKLITFLGEDFITAPAFPTTDNPNCFSGGLIDFVLTVTKKMIVSNDNLPENKKFDKNSLIKIGLLYSIGKYRLYKLKNSDWHIKQGIIYEYDSTLVSMRIGQRSLYIAMSNDINFSEEEAQAIIFHDVLDDKMVNYFPSKLTRMLKSAIELTFIEKK